MNTPADVLTAAAAGRPISMVTCYDAWSAKLITGTDVDCQVTTPRERVESHIAQRRREPATGMLAIEEYGHLGEVIHYPDRLRFAGRQQAVGVIILVGNCH